jgi:hypothetical protein
MNRPIAFVPALILAIAAGCASDTQKRDAINAVNEDFREAYEALLAEKGTRVFPVPLPKATASMRNALAAMGMRIIIEDSITGILQAAAPAPRPLSDQEWDEAISVDEPRLKNIAARHVGLASIFVSFEPRGLDVVITATLIESAGHTEISLTMRLRETVPVHQDFPRRDYPPPTAVSIGLDRIWDEFERELLASRTAER